ncbi:zinc-binding CMP/dCMP deaminase protein [Actinomadura verrucosospora]|uniref:Zinc-binding CMP/dCMP deaminase protein n=2 Tax=Actinomadura verrucosospora TaxID=46165 RepID=A0A7D3VRI0_ACTVE|nr:zinc-binding CMP/dCMP deaminase protein [Actinomadura verrucosospora]
MADAIMDDAGWLALACDLATLCPPSTTAFSVGAVIVGADGREIARGHSREADPHDHAEEAAIAKSGGVLRGATVYSSLEPCGNRASRPRPCAELIVAAGARRVVYAWREPSLFVEGTGAEILAAAGVELVELPELAGAAREPNAHLLAG